jgi:hypothetical protein
VVPRNRVANSLEGHFSHHSIPCQIYFDSALSFLGKDPDPVPPVLLVAFAIYWTAMALVLYYILRKINILKKK